MFDDDTPGAAGKPGWFAPYLGREPNPYEDDRDYANPNVTLQNKRQVNWIHPVCDILGALQAAGMCIEWMHEHARLPWRMFQQLVQRDGLWTWPDRPWLPLSLSVLATRVR